MRILASEADHVRRGAAEDGQEVSWFDYGLAPLGAISVF